MSATPHFRYLTAEDDIRAVMGACAEAFHDQSFNNPEAIEQLARKFSSAARFLVAHAEGEPLGFCAYYANDEVGRTAYLSMIIVRSAAQGMGLGSQLLARTIEDCQGLGMQRLRLEVARDNAAARTFYERRGFELEKHNEASDYLLLHFH